MKVEFDHDCIKMEESQMVVWQLKLPTLLTGVFMLSPLWPVSGNLQHLLVDITVWL